MTRSEQIKVISRSLIPTLTAGAVTATRIKETVFSPLTDLVAQMNGFENLTGAEKIALQNEFAFRFMHIRDLNESVFAEPYEHWFEAAKAHIDFHFWTDYQTYLLTESKFDKDTVDSIDHVTDKVLDLVGDPSKTGIGLRKGLVVGNVQSGKTADYIGAITKAADSGYRVIIVLAGILDNLRSQTQQRIDEGFVGVSKVEDTAEGGKKVITDKVVGVGHFGSSRPHGVLSLTTLQSDFNGRTARSITATFGKDDSTIYVAVIKKNSATLRSLIKWLDKGMCSLPMLLIDDEADNASINYKSDESPTTINKLIRDLLGKFQRTSYVGYTATPFANIFIDPDVVTADHGEDLFPRDFVVALDAPDRYMGPSRIFGENIAPEDDIVREIDDNDSTLPVGHKREAAVNFLPGSLKNALRLYVLATAIRICRGDDTCHSSALVNVSRFIDIHKKVASLVRSEVEIIKNAIKVCGLLPYTENAVMTELHDLFEKEYSQCGVDWNAVQSKLDQAASPVEVLEIHMEGDARQLDYSRENYPNGRRLIAVGGFSLSRGLTLEGLCSSYILRNSKMYDTLMQMGRWFGYRNGYSDLCRIFMTSDARAWYKHITSALVELWDEFREMEKARLTPAEFGLRVKAHPLNLIVTAKNKMKATVEMTMQVDFAGQKVETAHIPIRELAANRELLNTFVKNIGSPTATPEPCSGYYWDHVPNHFIKNFITSFRRTDVNMDTATGPICDYLDKLAAVGNDTCDVYLVSGKNTSIPSVAVSILSVVRENFSIEIEKATGNVILGGGRQHVTGADQERAGLGRILASQAFEDAQNAYLAEGHKSIPGHFYRKFRTKPLMILHVIDGHVKEGAEAPAYDCSEIVAWRLVFPGAKQSDRASRLVSYVLNPVAARHFIANSDEELTEVD